MHPVLITDQEFERLKIARETKKYGHLESWKELYLFQKAIGDTKQVKKIANWAKRARLGERIALPLALNIIKAEKQEVQYD